MAPSFSFETSSIAQSQVKWPEIQKQGKVSLSEFFDFKDKTAKIFASLLLTVLLYCCFNK